MSRIEELEKQITELDERKVALQHELELEKQKTEIEYPLKDGEQYWYVTTGGVTMDDTWSNHWVDRIYYEQGNVFLTEKEAQREIDRRALLSRFKQYRDKCNGNWKPDWKDKVKSKYFIVFNHESSELLLKWYIDVQPFESFGCFKNREDAIRAIELFGDEIIRLWVDE